jgi:membrane protease YdiL (CAAX protease family)
MKTILQNTPVIIKVIGYFLIMWSATLLAGAMPSLNDFWFFLLISAAVSWLLLGAEGRKISELNFVPTKKRHWIQLLAGTATGIVMLLITLAITLVLTGDAWHFNQSVSIATLVVVLLANLASAFVQEFVFRGYPFQALLQRYGLWPAQLLIAIPFGMMHLHAGMHLSDLLLTMLTTGMGSLLFGLAYYKTRNLALPVGLHFGWNYAQALIPRTTLGAAGTLGFVTGHGTHYSAYIIVGPYLLVIVGVIAILWSYRRLPRYE